MSRNQRPASSTGGLASFISAILTTPPPQRGPIPLDDDSDGGFDSQDAEDVEDLDESESEDGLDTESGAASDDIPPLQGEERPGATSRVPYEPEPLTDTSKRLELSDDPFQALACNDLHRRADVADGPDSGLWTVDQVKAVFPRQYRYPVQTFSPRHWPVAKPVSQEEYIKRFAAEYPEVMSILPIPNVVVAGGAAAWPLGEPAVKTGDVDLFIHGIAPDDRAALWKKADYIVKHLSARFLNGPADESSRRRYIDIVSHFLAPGVVTITAYSVEGSWRHRLSEETRKVQIVLRAYPSVSSILHAFDVPSCAVAFDGRRTYMTALAAYAHVFRVNLVVPAYRSTTYEARLAKYFERGFALAVPHLKPGLLAKGVPLQLPHLTLEPCVVRGLFAAGTLSLPAGAPAASSDYDSSQTWLSQVEDLCEFGPMNINIHQLQSGENRFVVMATVERAPARRRRRAADAKKGIKLARYAEKEPTLKDLLGREALAKHLERLAKGVVDPHGHVNIRSLRLVFGLNEEQVGRVLKAVSDALVKNLGRRLDLSAALAPFRTAVLAKYDALGADSAIPWWIVTEPGRQFTASNDPRMEKPEEWYGVAAAAAEVKIPSSDEYIEALLATLEARQSGIADEKKPIYDGLCAICHDTVARGDVNSVVLPCGHTFHWAVDEASGCSGLHAWVLEGHGDCPTCRRMYDPHGETEDGDSRPHRVPVDISW